MKSPLQKLVWLGALAVSTIAVPSDNSQTILDSLEKQAPYQWRPPTFDAVEDIVSQWVENGREFINRNGQTCACSRRELWWLENSLISDLRSACIGYHNSSSTVHPPQLCLLPTPNRGTNDLRPRSPAVFGISGHHHWQTPLLLVLRVQTLPRDCRLHLLDQR